MAQLDQGGFLVKQSRGAQYLVSGYVYVVVEDLNHSVEHWVFITDSEGNPALTNWIDPVVGNPESNALVVADTTAYANVGDFLNQRYHVNPSKRRYIRCDCTGMS